MNTPKELHPPFQTGVIDIGAHAVRLDIYELDRHWKAERLETLSRPLNLGADVFRNGFVSVENLGKLSAVVDDYKRKLNEYKVKHFRIIATSAIREAFNKELIVDRFRDSGITLEILEGNNEATMSFQAAREQLNLSIPETLDNALMLILGTGSLFVVGVRDSLMCFCEEIPSGTLRVSDALGSTAAPLEQLREQLRSQRVLRRFCEALQYDKKNPLSLVLLGNSARKLASLAGQNPVKDDECAVFSCKDFSKILDECISNPKKLMKKFDPEDADETAAAAVIVSHFTGQLRCKNVVCPGLTTRSALICDWIRQFRSAGEEPFRADLAAVCSAIGRKYGFDAMHASNVAAGCSILYNKLRHYFSFPAHSALLLEAAAYLHDIGRFVDAKKHQKHSWYLISNTQLPGISASEHRMIAAVARYHGKTMPNDNHPEYAALSSDEKVAVLKLASLLRVADALDLRNGEKIDFKPVLRGRNLFLKLDEKAAATVRYSLKIKGSLFEQVFGLELKLQE